MKIKITILLIISLPFVGCAGREANPVALHYPGDENRTCKSLQQEVAQNEVQLRKKYGKDASKFWTNVGWVILFPPAMDLKESEKIEADALQDRNKMLRILMAEKNCPYLMGEPNNVASPK